MKVEATQIPEVLIVDDQVGAPTSSECIAQATAKLLAQILAQAGGGLDGRSCIYNLTSSGETSWFGFAETLLTESSGTLGFTVLNLIPIRTSEFPRPAKRPANSRLSCQCLEQTFGVTLPHWKNALTLVPETIVERSSRVTS